MPVVEPSPVEEKKPKEESTAVKKNKRKRASEEGKRKNKSNSQEYLEMETAGAMSREDDQETARRLAKKRKVGKGQLGGDNGFDSDFSSVSEKKVYDSKVAVDAELDLKKGKKMKEELGDGGSVMGEENGGLVCESEDKIKQDKKQRKKKKKRANKDAMVLEEPNNVDMGQGDDRAICESEKCSVTLEGGNQVDMSKGEDKKRKDKKKRKEGGNVAQDVGPNTLAAVDLKCGNKESKKKEDTNEAGKMGKQKVAQRKDKGKQVSFADAVEVLGDCVDDEVSDEGGVDDEEVDEGSKSARARTLCFTPEEDAALMEAMMNYIEMKQLGEKGSEMILTSGKHPELKGCWTEIAKALPHRPCLAVCTRGRYLLRRSAAQKSEKCDSELVHTKRFSPEEDAKLMEAMMNYAEMKQLGEKGLEMIRARLKHPELRGCWAEIAKALPHRPPTAVYKRARILLYRSDARKWTEEEYEIIRRFVEENGTNWVKLAAELGKSDIHVKDTWRRIKLKNLKKGAWTQDEYQNLFDLVNWDLRIKAHEKINHGHRRIRENIAWEAISDKLSTRNNKDCCLKWYQQLASSLVKQGVWADTDDYLLVEALQKVDAVCFEDVDWDNLLDHRSGELCRHRWNQMVRLLGGHRERPFIEQVEVLSRRYCLEVMDFRKGEVL